MAPRKTIRPYHAAAGGWGALRATGEALAEQGIAVSGSATLLHVNQPTGFDCPGCAWPDPKHTSSFEFCENGVKAPLPAVALNLICPPMTVAPAGGGTPLAGDGPNPYISCASVSPLLRVLAICPSMIATARGSLVTKFNPKPIITKEVLVVELGFGALT